MCARETRAKFAEIEIGAPGRTRTSTMFPPPDFESGASTNSATGASRPDHSGEAQGVNAHTIAVFAPIYDAPVCDAPGHDARSPTAGIAERRHGRLEHQHDPLPAARGGGDRDRGGRRGGDPGRL